MKKIIAMIFMLSLLVAVPFAQADNTSPPVVGEYVLTQDVTDLATTSPVIEIILYQVCTYFAMDATTEPGESSFYANEKQYDSSTNSLAILSNYSMNLLEFLGPGDKQGLTCYKGLNTQKIDNDEYYQKRFLGPGDIQTTPNFG